MSAEQQTLGPLPPALNPLKRQRACVACKDSKVRCKRDVGSPGAVCERCSIIGRSCITLTSTKNKRPRRKISTVTSLESKVDALVAALKERQNAELGEHGLRKSDSGGLGLISISLFSTVHPRRLTGDTGSNATNAFPAMRAGSKDAILETGQAGGSVTSARNGLNAGANNLQAEHRYSFSFFLPRPVSTNNDHTDDVVDKGLISLVEAEECFVRFTEVMLPHFPMVVFPASMTVSIMRRTRPVLFLSILGAASGCLGESIRETLMEEVMKVYADRIIMNGERNLDLVQAIQVSTIWYFPPERFDDLRVYQFIHTASIMVTELDFIRIARPNTSRSSLERDIGVGHPSLINVASNEPQAEYQRALLCCYILCGISSMIMRRRNLMPWSRYMNNCLDALEKASPPQKSDLFLCQWVRSQQIAEEAGRHLFMDDPSANVDIHELSVQYTVRAYEQRCDQWKENIPQELLSPTLEVEAGILKLYLHENFLLDNHHFKKSTASLSRDSPGLIHEINNQSFCPIHYKSISICLISVKKVLDIFLSFDMETLCSMPIFLYARTAYATFTMMKISFAASRLNNDLQAMVEKDLNVEFYINELLRSLQEVSRTKKLRAAAIFRLLMLMLRTWFIRRKAQIEPDRMHTGQEDTILHTVLRTANAINTDGGAKAIEVAVSASGFETPAAPGNNVPPGMEMWSSDQDDEMLPWSELEFENFLQKDDSMFLEVALGRLAGLVG